MTKRSSNQANTQGRGRGRPRQSDAFRVVPIPHAQLDPKKLGRVIVALALHKSEQQAASSAEAGDETA